MTYVLTHVDTLLFQNETGSHLYLHICNRRSSPSTFAVFTVKAPDIKMNV